MKNYWILTRVMLKNMLASLNPKNGAYADGKRKRSSVVRTVFAALACIVALGSVIWLEVLIYRGLKQFRMPMMLPGMAIFISMMFTLVMGLFQCLSELFQGRDAPFLAVLPLTSRQVFAARMTTLYLSELAVDALICVPAFVLYSVGQGSVLPVLLTGLPVLLLLPLIPLSVVTLVASLVMRVGFLSRHRDTIVMILSMVFALAYSLSVTMMNSNNQDPAQLMMTLAAPNGLLELMLKRLPPAMWAVRGLTGDAGMLLLFAAVSLALAAGVLLLVGPGYLDQALTSTEKTVHRKKNTGSFSWNTSSAFRALHILEWRELLRTPAWAYNSLFGVVMLPLMIGIGVVTGFSKSGEGVEGMRTLLANVDPGYVALITAALIMFGGMVNPAVATAISREGGRWPFALTLPVRQRTRFLAKLAVGAEINLVCMLLIAVVAWFVTRMNVVWLLAAFLLAGIIGLAAAVFSLWVDAMRPQLNWMTEMEAIKKNFNQVLGMLLWVAMTALCVIPAVLLWNRGGWIAMAGVAAVAAAELAVSVILLNRATEKNTVLPES